MQTDRNLLVRRYRHRIDPNANAAEAYGYWILLVGTFAALSGVVLFLYGSTFPRGESTYWAYRQAGIVLAAGGLPVALLGVTFRLTLQPVASALGGLGVITATAAIGWFVRLYPGDWTFAGPRPVMLTYLAGIALLAAGLAIVPMTTSRLAATDATDHPYYELEQVAGGWQWQLCGGDHVALAESGVTFPDRAAARTALDDVAAATPIAGTEVTVVHDTTSPPDPDLDPTATREA